MGTLWDAAPWDFAEVCEPFTRPLYEAALAAAEPLAGRRLLDVGCGAGGALALAAGYGAEVTGLDASEPMLAVARERLPAADLHVGDLQDLPFGDGVFAVVTAFNAVQYAADPAAAVAELARVTGPGGLVVIGVWAGPERCETEALFQRIRALVSAAGDPLALSAAGVVEQLLVTAGLTVTGFGEVPCPFTYPDLETGWRGQSSIGPLRRAIDVAGESAVREVFAEVLAGHRQPDGSYRQDNVFRYVSASR